MRAERLEVPIQYENHELFVHELCYHELCYDVCVILKVNTYDMMVLSDSYFSDPKPLPSQLGAYTIAITFRKAASIMDCSTTAT